MPHPHVLPRPRVIGLAVRLLLAAGIIAGLLGMHVMMSPTAHAAHSATTVTMTKSPVSPHGEHAAVHPPSDDCSASACADALPRPDPGVWAVVCVLALLLTALLAARPAVFWRTPPRRADAADRGSRVAGDSGPRHPPSLIVLSISRT
ncbi:MAG: DUF6153 family protein [Microbacterium sp.]|uniref:DUF6153 family protein n=1 Tax=Microbacterium sp. TaxID=51671 RepID=UPI003F813B9C